MKEVITFHVVFCHHAWLLMWRNPHSGNWPLPLTSSSPHRTGWGCCCACWALCCSSSHTLWHLQQGNKNEMFKQETLFSLPERGLGLLEQTAGQHLSALAWNVAGAAQGDLGAWQNHSSGCKQPWPWCQGTLSLSWGMRAPLEGLWQWGRQFPPWLFLPLPQSSGFKGAEDGHCEP